LIFWQPPDRIQQTQRIRRLGRDTLAPIFPLEFRWVLRIGQSFEYDFAGQAPIDPTLEPARQSASNPIASINPNVNFIVGSLPTAPIPSQVRTGLTAGGKRIRTAGPTCDRDAD
jgi:hypothetical protein